MNDAIFQAQTPYGLERFETIGYYLIDIPVVDLNLDSKLEGLNGTNEIAYVIVEKKQMSPVYIKVIWNLYRNVFNYKDLNDRTYYDYQDINESKIKQIAIEKLKSDPEYSFLYLP